MDNDYGMNYSPDPPERWKCPCCGSTFHDREWVDKDVLITDFMLQAVENYVAKDEEDAFSILSFENEESQKIKNIIIEILHYKNIEIKEIQNQIDFLYTKIDFNFHVSEKWKMMMDDPENVYPKIERLREKLDARENEILHKIVDILPYLWS